MKGFPIPEKVLEQHLVVLGKTGAGKSSALRSIVEPLLEQGRRVCIIDPKGDWYGLKWSADGKGEGYPIIGFGEFKEPKATDIPLNPQAGKQMAELISSGNRPCIIGFRGWMPGAMTRFWIDFASTMFNTINGELYLVIDEVHNFAAKGKIMDVDAGKCLHWTNRLLSEARGLGLICLVASQRPAKVHNDTLTCCETLVAMRANHPSDRKASSDWIEGCGDEEQGKLVLNSLASLARGEAYVWSPEAKFGPERVKFPMFKTFDSFAPPQLHKRVSGSGWANVNLESVKEKLASVIQDHKANDPAELKRTIADLRRKVSELERQAPEVKQSEPVEVPIFDNKVKEQISAAVELMVDFSERSKIARDVLDSRSREIQSLLAGSLSSLSKFKITPKSAFVPTRHAARMPAPLPVVRHAETNGSLGKCERAILSALAQYPQGRSANQIAVLTGYSVNSGGFNNSLSKLRSSGYVTRGQPILATDAGLAALGHYDPLPTGKDLASFWLAKVGLCERRILEHLISKYPDSLTADQVAEAIRYSPNSGGFNNALSRLRTLELITRGQPMKASGEFFND